ncbi:MAG: (2Fe-2S)-binding protein [Thermoanaerobaculia bacterium]|nr:(2Fe-2S)-binding protein [Thermoanaerobaculia bacterium]
MGSRKHEEGSGDGVSRRDFLKGGAAGAVVGGMASRAQGAAAADAVSGTDVVGPGPVAVTLTVNGERREARIEPRVTLLDALRDRLDLTGAKKVCDRATCGACTVLVDGAPVYACSVLAIEAQGAEITTVEGLGSPEDLHPVQAAFVANDAQQCGYCTPGFVVACKAFLDAHPEPTLAEIERGLGGNLCRCGTYNGIKQVLLAGGEA